MKYKGIIFDLDGVICSTDKYHYLAWKNIADSIGVCFDEKINNRLRGISRMKSLEIILERSERHFSEDEKKSLTDTKNEQYRELLMDMSPADLSYEVKSTLDSLRRKGIKLAIGSSSRNAKLILDRLGLRDYFDAVSDGNNITHSKPDPEVFLAAADMLGLDPGSCLVVEDALAGIEASVAGGFESAGIGDAAEHPHVTYRLNSFSDLLETV